MIIWTSKSWEDFERLAADEPKLVKKVIRLIKDIERNGYQGIGKPEPLVGDLSGYWSWRIDRKNRIVYKVDGDDVKIIQCRTHYGEK